MKIQVIAMSRTKASVIYFDSIPFRHWSLCIQHGRDNFELHEINGESGRYHYDTGKYTSDPQQMPGYLETVQLGRVNTRDTDRLRKLAEEQEIRKHWNWHCQNWIVNLIIRLCNEGILNVSDETMEKLRRDRQSLNDDFDPDRPERIPTPE